MDSSNPNAIETLISEAIPFGRLSRETIRAAQEELADLWATAGLLAVEKAELRRENERLRAELAEANIERTEQARLLGMSAETELKLRARVEGLEARAAVPEAVAKVPVDPDVETLKRMHEAYWGSSTSNYWHENSEPLWRKTYAAILSAADTEVKNGH